MRGGCNHKRALRDGLRPFVCEFFTAGLLTASLVTSVTWTCPKGVNIRLEGAVLAVGEEANACAEVAERESLSTRGCPRIT